MGAEVGIEGHADVAQERPALVSDRYFTFFNIQQAMNEMLVEVV